MTPLGGGEFNNDEELALDPSPRAGLNNIIFTAYYARLQPSSSLRVCAINCFNVIYNNITTARLFIIILLLYLR